MVVCLWRSARTPSAMQGSSHFLLGVWSWSMVLRTMCFAFVENFFAYGSITKREEGECYNFVATRVEYM